MTLYLALDYKADSEIQRVSRASLQHHGRWAVFNIDYIFRAVDAQYNAKYYANMHIA